MWFRLHKTAEHSLSAVLRQTTQPAFPLSHACLAADAEQQLKLLREVKDAIPALDMHSHVRLLETYWPTFVRVLDSVAVVQQAASPQPKVRKAVLEILQR